MTDHPGRRPGREPGRVVLEHAVEAVRRFGELEGEAELGHAGLDGPLAHGRARQVERGRVVVLHHDDDVDEGRSARVRGQLQLVHQAIERVRLMLERGRRAARHVGDEIGEAGRGAERQPHRQQVDVEANLVLERGDLAARDGHAEHHLALPGVAIQQDLHGRHQRHEQAAVARPGQRADVAGQDRVEVEAQVAPLVRAHARRREVERQSQRLDRRRERVHPVPAIGGAGLGLETAGLPRRVPLSWKGSGSSDSDRPSSRAA